MMCDAMLCALVCAGAAACLASSPLADPCCASTSAVLAAMPARTLLLLSTAVAAAAATSVSQWVHLGDGTKMPALNLGTCCGSKPTIGVGPWVSAPSPSFYGPLRLQFYLCHACSSR